MRAASRELYSLMVAQLRDDGHHEAAAAVSHATRVPYTAPSTPTPPPRSLLSLYESTVKASTSRLTLDESTAAAPRTMHAHGSAPLDAAVARFSADGASLAVGGTDGVVHLVDRESLALQGARALGGAPRWGEEQTAEAPSPSPIADLDLHPTSPFLVTVGKVTLGRHPGHPPPPYPTPLPPLLPLSSTSPFPFSPPPTHARTHTHTFHSTHTHSSPPTLFPTLPPPSL